MIGRRRLAPLAALAALSVCFVVRTGDIVRRTSITIDEHRNLYDGYRFLRTGETVGRADIADEQPPLGRLCFGLPLLPLGLDLPPEDRPEDRAVTGERLFYTRGIDFVFANRIPGDALLSRARGAGVVLGLGLGWLVALAAWRLAGPWPAVFAFALHVACPNLAAHAAVTNTDVAGALAFFAASLAFAALAVRPTLVRAALGGALLAAALLAKLVTLALLPGLTVVLALSACDRRLAAGGILRRIEAGRRPAAGAVLVRLVALGVLAAVAVAGIWAGFGFHRQRLALPVEAIDPARLADRVLLALRSTDLLPQSFWMNLFATVAHGTWWRHQGYLLGEATYGGSPWFYPVALVVKLPLASLAAAGTGLVTFLVRLRAPRSLPAEALYLAPPPLVLAAILITSRLNIGIRHALPLLPFLYLAAAALASVLLRRGRRGGAVALALAVLAGVESLAAHPFELSFFNRLAGGSSGGYRVLADSNLDWGQGLKALRADLDRQGLNGRIWLAFFGLPVVDRYGIRAEELPTLTRNTRPDPSDAFDPGAGPALLVVSTNEMLGLYRDGPSPWRDLRDRPHRTLAGGSLWVFDAGGNAALRALVGECYREAGDARRARFHLLGALALDPHEPRALAGLVHLALDRAAAGEAAGWLAAAPEGSGAVAVARARLLLAEDRAAAAVAVLAAALERDPSSYDAHLTLALVVLARGGAPPEVGLAAARRASALEPSVALAHDVMASFLARAGDLAGAAAAESAAVIRVTSQERLAEYRQKLAGYRQQAVR